MMCFFKSPAETKRQLNRTTGCVSIMTMGLPRPRATHYVRKCGKKLGKSAGGSFSMSL